MFAAFDKTYDHPQLVWTADGEDLSHTLEILDVHSVRQFRELDANYPFAMKGQSFFVTTNSGVSLLFEAVSEVQMSRIVSALRGIVQNLSKKIIAVSLL